MMFMPMFSPTHAPAGVTMVAGEWDASEGSGAYVYGYSGGPAIPVPIGTISNEPLAGHVLFHLLYISFQAQTQITYQGDVADILATKILYVDDAPYPLSSAEYYAEPIPNTSVMWQDNTGPIFANGVSYNIRVE